MCGSGCRRGLGAQTWEQDPPLGSDEGTLLCQDLNPGLWIPNQAPCSIPGHPVRDRTRGHRPLGSHVQGTGGAELESSVRNLLKKIPRVPWTAKRSNQSILKEISPEYSLEGLTLKLKLQYFGHLMRRADSLEKTLMLGKIEDRRRRDDRG